MSVGGNILSNFLNLAASAAGSADTSNGYVPIADLGPQDFDSTGNAHIQVFGLALQVSEVLDWRQERRLYGFTAIVTRMAGSTQTPAQNRESLLLHIDAIHSDLEDDRRLSDSVDWCHIDSWALAERVDDTGNLMVVAMEVIAEVIV